MQPRIAFQSSLARTGSWVQLVPDPGSQPSTSGLNTREIHHGDSFAGDTGTVMPPIFPSSTFAHGNAGVFDYTRSSNPNIRILDGMLPSVEGCAHATVFASGVSAITALVSHLKQGDLVLCEENLYGCTACLFDSKSLIMSAAQ